MKIRRILCAILAVIVLVLLTPSYTVSFAVSTDDLKFELNEDEASYYVSGCDENASGILEIPDMYNEKPVTSVGSDAFSGFTGLTRITIPDSITEIGSCAFYECTGLESIIIPDSVTHIGYEAFSGCAGLKNVTIPDSVFSIGDNAFTDTFWFNNQPDGMVYAGKVAYKYKGDMPDNTSIELAEGSRGIAEYAFYGCSGLDRITIPNSVLCIGEGAFGLCTGLSTITIPNLVESIGDEVFSDCADLSNIIIPYSVTSVGFLVFGNCARLASITLPDSLTDIGGYAFYGCSSELKIYCYENSSAHSYAINDSYLYDFIRIYPASVDTNVIAHRFLVSTSRERESVLSNLVTAVDGFTTQGTPVRGELFGTGSTVSVYDNSNKLVTTYSVVLSGDLDGTGCVDAVDCMLAELTSSGHRTLTDTEDTAGAFRAANDVNSDGVCNSADFTVIMNKAVK